MPELPRLVAAEGNHIVHFSNKAGSFWAGETQKSSSHWSTGFVSHRSRLFGDHTLLVEGLPLERSTGMRTLYSPAELVRDYPRGVSERVFMLDGVDGLGIVLGGSLRSPIGLRLDDVASEEGVRAAFADTLGHRIAWWPVKGSVAKVMAVATDAAEATAFLNDDGSQFEMQLAGQMRTQYAFGIGFGGDQAEALASAIYILENYAEALARKENRIAALYEASRFVTADDTLNQAFLWALASFDALNMDEAETGLGKGIYAGYPWFQDYWGRDSFIALRALTVTGQFGLAAENLRSFLRFQIMADTSADYGKIPNRVRPDESIYNTADATPRFLIEADRYVAYSGDTAFAMAIYPNIAAAVRGTLRHRVSPHGLLVHGPADTWMDAVGPKGPYSPRADRAVDIQGLWIDALQAAERLSVLATGRENDSLAVTAANARERALAAFWRQFVVDETLSANPRIPHLYDALAADGRPSAQVRPNALFAYHLLPDPAKRAALAERLTARLGTPWGPMSLAADDPWFHPYHKTESWYEQDASYHNGIIWLWNNGIWIEALVRHGLQEQAAEVMRNYADLMFENVALGTLPELIDAMPRLGRFKSDYPDSANFAGISRIDQMSLRNEAQVDEAVPAVSGTWSQAWSLSEFIRNLLEDFGGLSYEVGNGFRLFPAIPQAWGNVQIRRMFAGYTLVMDFQQGETEQVLLRFEGSDTARPMSLPFRLPGMDQAVLLKLDGGHDAYLIRHEEGGWAFSRNGNPYRPDPAVYEEWLDVTRAGTMRWPLWDSSEHDVDAAVYKSQLK